MKRILLLIIFIFVAFIFYIYYSTTNSKSGVVSLHGLYGKVTVYWDNYDVPHIVADKSDADAFFALGYVHAMDHFWQMEFQRRVAQGRLSEILGAKAVKMDKFLRTLGFYRAAQQDWPYYSKQMKKIVHSYTMGVNAFLQHGHLPLQFKLLHYKPEKWTDIDSIVWEKLMSWDLENAWLQKVNNYLVAQKFGKSAVTKIFPPYPQDRATILSKLDLIKSNIIGHKKSDTMPIADLAINSLERTAKLARSVRRSLGYGYAPGKGSNNWVISGRFTKSGKPILANDPHLALSAPALWYLAELKGPHLHVIGATIPGVPEVIIGHNDHIAWGVTNVNPDVQELYIEPKDIKLKELHEIIKVKGKPDVPFTVFFSKHGPIINNVINQVAPKFLDNKIALKWTALQPGDITLQSFMEIDYANNWSSFVAALRDYVSPAQNFVYADTKGNIGYYMPGKIPLRNGWDGAFPVADDAKHQWTGFIPFNKLPHVFNPPEGLIVSANNKAVPDNYPYRITFRWKHAPYRAERILELLKGRYNFTVADNARIQNDVVSLMWREFKPFLLKTKATTKLGQEALKMLSRWHGDMSLQSKAASIFAVWYAILDKHLRQGLPIKHYEFNPLYVKAHLTNLNLLAQTLKETVDFLNKKLGANPEHWQWGKIHQAEFSELALGKVKLIDWIWNREIATPGGEATVDVGTYDTNSFIQTHGASYRQIVDLSNLNNSLYNQTLGQSGNPFSHHYADLMPLWRAGKYLPMSSMKSLWGKVRVMYLVSK